MAKKKILFESKEKTEKVFGNEESVLVRIDGTEFCIARHGNTYFVFESRCPHFDYPLIEGHLNPYGQIVCAWHGYRFDLKSGAETQRRCRSLFVRQAYWGQEGQLQVDL